MAEGKRYNVCFPRKYVSGGQEKTHFWIVGTGWPLKDGKDGITVELYTNVLPGKKLVILPAKTREDSTDEPGREPGEDDIPF